MISINHYLQIKSSSQRIFDAIKNVEGIRAWWAPFAMYNDKKELEIWFNEEKSIFIMSIVNENEPNFLEWSCKSEITEWDDTQILFRIVPEESYCSLFFIHDNWSKINQLYAQCSYDWAHYLQCLQEYAETGEKQVGFDKKRFGTYYA